MRSSNRRCLDACGARRRSIARSASRASCGRIGNVADRSGALLKDRLPPHHLVELLLKLFLVKELPAGHAVNTGAHLGKAVLVGVLHRSLARRHVGKHVVLKREIGGGHHRPARHNNERTHHRPESHRAETDLTASVPKRKDTGAGTPLAHLARPCAVVACTPASTVVAMGDTVCHGRAIVTARIILIRIGNGMMNGARRHADFSCQPNPTLRSRVRDQLYGSDGSSEWLIFGKWWPNR